MPSRGWLLSFEQRAMEGLVSTSMIRVYRIDSGKKEIRDFQGQPIP